MVKMRVLVSDKLAEEGLKILREGDVFEVDTKYDLKPEDYPNAERHWQGVVTLPVYPSMSEAELAYVVSAVKQALPG